MNYGILQNNIPQKLKKKFRYLKKLCKKINNFEWSIMYNKTCINEETLPKYVIFLRNNKLINFLKIYKFGTRDFV